MKTIEIDFSSITDLEELYQSLKTNLNLPDYFGENLDALADCLTSDVEMPLNLEFTELSVDQLEDFEEILDTLDELSEEIEGFNFAYFLEQFDEE